MFHPNELLSFEDAVDACVINSGGKGTLTIRAKIISLCRFLFFKKRTFLKI